MVYHLLCQFVIKIEVTSELSYTHLDFLKWLPQTTFHLHNLQIIFFAVILT